MVTFPNGYNLNVGDFEDRMITHLGEYLSAIPMVLKNSIFLDKCPNCNKKNCRVDLCKSYEKKREIVDKDGITTYEIVECFICGVSKMLVHLDCCKNANYCKECLTNYQNYNSGSSSSSRT